MIGPGAVVAEKYWVERVLGRGGMGIVVAATHLQLGQRVALKFLKPEAARDSDLVERFLREARSASRLRGEHVGKVVDVGTSEYGPYIVMEYLDGHDLSSTLAHGGPMPVATAVDYVLQACLGLVEAHAAGVIHRDLKPANLFLTRRPDGTALVKVMDFGIAKAAGANDAAITESSAVMGSPGYMSPEQLRSARDVDARTDVWSLGVVLYELVSGRRPYEAQTITELAVLIATEDVPAIPASVPRGFADAVMRCLEKDVRRRWRDVAAMAAAIAPFGSPGAEQIAAAVGRVHVGPAVEAREPAVAALMHATTLSRATSVRAPGARRGATTMRRKASILALAAAITGVGVAITIVLLSGSSPTRAGGADDSRAPIAPSAATVPAVAAPVEDAGVVDVAVPAIDAGVAPDAAVEAPTGTKPKSGGRPSVGSGRGSSTGATAGSAAASGTGGGSAGSAAPPPDKPVDLCPNGRPRIANDFDCDGIPDLR